MPFNWVCPFTSVLFLLCSFGLCGFLNPCCFNQKNGQSTLPRIIRISWYVKNKQKTNFHIYKLSNIVLFIRVQKFENAWFFLPIISVTAQIYICMYVSVCPLYKMYLEKNKKKKNSCVKNTKRNCTEKNDCMIFLKYYNNNYNIILNDKHCEYTDLSVTLVLKCTGCLSNVSEMFVIKL